jgi:hypothetical protein
MEITISGEETLERFVTRRPNPEEWLKEVL